jgi:hypothetical protein
VCVKTPLPQATPCIHMAHLTGGCVCVCACVRACVCLCVHACVCVSFWARGIFTGRGVCPLPDFRDAPYTQEVQGSSLSLSLPPSLSLSFSLSLSLSLSLSRARREGMPCHVTWRTPSPTGGSGVGSGGGPAFRLVSERASKRLFPYIHTLCVWCTLQGGDTRGS